LGLDAKAFADALDQHKHQAAVDADVAAANKAGISGTPAFLVNDYYVSGAQPIRKFKKLVKLALAGK
ncbi:MAG: DsbA family protein, partial [Minicystis sp.]